jgi:hypothetical protein
MTEALSRTPDNINNPTPASVRASLPVHLAPPIDIMTTEAEKAACFVSREMYQGHDINR